MFIMIININIKYMFELNFRVKGGKDLPKCDMQLMKTVSEKGLFTFYREQGEFEEEQKQLCQLKHEIPMKKIKEEKLSQEKTYKKTEEKHRKRQKKCGDEKSLANQINNLANSQLNQKQLIKRVIRQHLPQLSNYQRSDKYVTREQQHKNAIKDTKQYNFSNKLKSKVGTKSSIEATLETKTNPMKSRINTDNQSMTLLPKTTNLTRIQSHERKTSLRSKQLEIDQHQFRINENLSQLKIRSRRFHKKHVSMDMTPNKKTAQRYKSLSCNEQNSHQRKKILVPNKFKFATLQSPLIQTQSLSINLVNLSFSNKRQSRQRNKPEIITNVLNGQNINQRYRKQIQPIKFPFIRNRNFIQFKKEIKKLTENCLAQYKSNKQNFSKCIKINKNSNHESAPLSHRSKQWRSKSIEICKDKLFAYSQKQLEPQEQEQRDKLVIDPENKYNFNQQILRKNSWMSVKRMLKKIVKQKIVNLL